MFRVSNFAKYAASAKAALSNREAASTQQNLETINAAVNKLTEIVQKYNGGLLAASPISSQVAALGQDLKNAIADAKTSEMVNDEEAQRIIDYILQVLEPSIKQSMVALKEKKAELAAANLQGTVLGDTKDLRAQTAEFSAELVRKAPAAKHPESNKANAVVDADFEDAIKFFS